MTTKLELSSRLVDFQAILDYADLTNDRNPIHVDHEFAAKTPFGGVIAHGTMSVALIWQALARTLGKDVLERVDLDIRFLKPVRIGDCVAGGGDLRPGTESVYDVWVRTQAGEGEPVISGTATVRHV